MIPGGPGYAFGAMKPGVPGGMPKRLKKGKYGVL
jgi:hypothetical protein